MVCGDSRVTALAREGGRWNVTTAHGPAVSADQVLLATNGYTDGLWPQLRQTVIAVLRSTLSRATFIEGYEPLLRHSISVHEGLVEAIADHEQSDFIKVMLLHNDDPIRTGDPRRSPVRPG